MRSTIPILNLIKFIYEHFLQSLKLLFHSVVPKTPTLTSSISASTLLTGTKVTLTCKTSSQGQVSYKFLLNGQEIAGSGPGSSYEVTSSVGSSSYTCTATINGVQSTASSRHLIKFVGNLF